MSTIPPPLPMVPLGYASGEAQNPWVAVARVWAWFAVLIGIAQFIQNAIQFCMVIEPAGVIRVGIPSWIPGMAGSIFTGGMYAAKAVGSGLVAVGGLIFITNRRGRMLIVTATLVVIGFGFLSNGAWVVERLLNTFGTGRSGLYYNLSWTARSILYLLVDVAFHLMLVWPFMKMGRSGS